MSRLFYWDDDMQILLVPKSIMCSTQIHSTKKSEKLDISHVMQGAPTSLEFRNIRTDLFRKQFSFDTLKEKENDFY